MLLSGAVWAQPLTLNGVELGMSPEQVRALHGEPELRGSDTWSYCYTPGATWPNVQTQVTFDAGNRVCAVRGSTLEFDKQRYLLSNLADLQTRFPDLHLAVDGSRRFYLGWKPALLETDPIRLQERMGPYHPSVWAVQLENFERMRELAGVMRTSPDPFSRPSDGKLLARLLPDFPRSPRVVDLPDAHLWQEAEAPVPPWMKARVRVDPEEKAQAEFVRELLGRPHRDWPAFLARNRQLLTPLFLTRCRQRADHHLHNEISLGDGLDFLSLCEQAQQVKGAPGPDVTSFEHRAGILHVLAEPSKSRGCILGLVAQPGRKTNFWRPADSEQVANAEVLVDGRWRTRSNEQGAFAVWNLPTGPHQVTVRQGGRTKVTRVVVKAYPAGLETSYLAYGWAPSLRRELHLVAIESDCPPGLELEHAELQTDLDLDGYFANCNDPINDPHMMVTWNLALGAESHRFESGRLSWQARVRVRNRSSDIIRKFYLVLDLDGTRSRVLVPRPWQGNLGPGASVDLSLPARSAAVRRAILHLSHEPTRLYSHPELP